MRSLSILVALHLFSPTTTAQCGDDAFENNDTIATAAPVGPGNYPGLVVTSSQSACGVDEDFYRIDVPDGSVLRLDIFFDSEVSNLNLWAYDDPADYPLNWIARSSSTRSHEVVWVPNHSGGVQTVYVWVDGFNAFETSVYSMDVAVIPDPCFGAADDAFEPNDDCSSAVPLLPGRYTSLHVSDSDEDHYAIDLLAGHAIRIRALAPYDPVADLGLYLRDRCGSVLRTALSADDDELLTYVNSTGATQSLVIQPLISTGSFGVCLGYDLAIETFPDPCPDLAADPFEPNQDCEAATPLGPGTYGGLTVHLGDLDVYRTLVPAGETLNVRLFFEHDEGNVDVQSFAPGLECTHIIEESGQSITDDETLTTLNLTGSDVEYFWQVFIGPGTLSCNSYTMSVEVTGRTGNSFCDASDGTLATCPCANPGLPDTGCDIAQGTGGFALAIAAQQTSPQDRATLVGAGYPVMSSPGVTVIRSTSLDPAGAIVFGDGLRCIGVPVVRVGAVLAAGGTSTQTIGHGGGAGSGTFFYQLWVRNTPSMYCTPDAFNLSNGREIVW